MTEQERFWSYVNKTNTCWLWKGALIRGYGNFRRGKEGNFKNVRAHRFSYELVKGPINDQLDHLCRVRNCVNPDHLEDVDSRTNLLRGETAAARNAAKTECPRCQRPYKVYPNGRRRCSACELADERIRRPGHHY